MQNHPRNSVCLKVISQSTNQQNLKLVGWPLLFLVLAAFATLMA